MLGRQSRLCLAIVSAVLLAYLKNDAPAVPNASNWLAPLDSCLSRGSPDLDGDSIVHATKCRRRSMWFISFLSSPDHTGYETNPTC